MGQWWQQGPKKFVFGHNICKSVPQIGRINTLRIWNFQNKDLRVCGTTKGLRDKFCTHLLWSCFPKTPLHSEFSICDGFLWIGASHRNSKGVGNISDYCAQQHQPAPGMESAQLWSRKKRRVFEQNPTSGKFNLKKNASLRRRTPIIPVKGLRVCTCKGTMSLFIRNSKCMRNLDLARPASRISV